MKKINGINLDGTARTPPICDFCLLPGVAWAYPVEGFALYPEEDDSGWAACEPCSALVEADALDGLVERAARYSSKRATREYGRKVPPALLMPQLRTTYGRFWKAKGERVPSPPDMPYDPTKTEQAIQERWQQLITIPGNTVNLAVDGSHHDQDKTFSFDAMDAVRDQLMTFIMTRVTRKWDATQVAPHHMVCEVSVKLDGEDFELGTVNLISMPDGSIRIGE